ncbi:septin-2 [Dermatophagoides farinae]|uniref:Septin n=1 Tax=Dermatophagoides farinae TaxID=6954 RepID=A0A922IG34_DERFA|nr:septin-2-like [Dermatophagoides farinae]KAH7637822.1 septin-like protein [Dermatophagoides farinae]KAH9528824.1 septin 2 [Dermatophagoides farinae]
MATTTSYLGFANLPNQVQRKFAKKGFEFNLMVVGESGLGKTTLINSLFGTNINSNRKIPTTQELLDRTLSIETTSLDIEERGVRLKLTVVDTPGYGDALNCSDNYDPILQYIDEQHRKYLTNESGLNRRQIRDTRVHCCFFFISPINYGLKPADVRFLKLLQHKVNIVPLIAKSDFLTPNETSTLKKRILEEIKQHQIDIYTIPDCDPDDDIEYKEHVRQLQNSMPFAVSSSVDIIEVNGERIRGREYPWGIVRTECDDHSDYVKLRSMLVSQMQDLHEVTHDLHYENYRSLHLANSGGDMSPMTRRFNTSDVRDNVSILSGMTMDETEKDRLLLEKEAEIRRMQQELAKIQDQIRLQSLQQNDLTTTVAANGATNGHSK